MYVNGLALPSARLVDSTYPSLHTSGDSSTLYKICNELYLTKLVGNNVSIVVPHSRQAKENVMHYKRVAEHGTTETYEQTKAKEEAINTAAFTQGEYATLCRGNTSQVMAFTFVSHRQPKFMFRRTHS